MTKNLGVTESIEMISNHSFNIAEELKSAMIEGYFDEQLIIDIGQSFLNWRSRINKIENPYCVWYWDNSCWSKVTQDMYKEDAYREWYRLTRGGKNNATPNSENYYYLGLASEDLQGRHPIESEEDYFSIRYLLSKSFGE